MTETTKMIKAIANDSKVRIDRIVANYEQLEKENAELKDNRDYWKESSIYWHKQLKNKKYRRIAKATQHQLTKAKEIIRELLSSCFGYNSKTVNYEVKAKAEQFLSEIEK